MTKKENYFKAIKGEVPEWIPVYMDACQWFAPACIASPVITGKPVDIYGIPWIIDDMGAIPIPGKPLLSDINEWQEKFTIPDLRYFDWEAAAKQEIPKLDKERAVALHVHSVFNVFINAMGFEGGLTALYSDPETVMDFLDTLSNFQELIIEKSLRYYDVIDIFNITDDIANAKNLFVSPKMYREFFLPFHKRQIELARRIRPDILVEMHCCGKCEALLDEWINIGVTIWQPAQPMNDLKSIRAKYGSKLVLNGAWDVSGPGGVPFADEKTVRQSVRDTIDRYAPGGGFVFWSQGPFGKSEDMIQKLSWVDDEARKYGVDFYKKN
jgi:uroporphyrinogen-III decarboxylase